MENTAFLSTQSFLMVTKKIHCYNKQLQFYNVSKATSRQRQLSKGWLNIITSCCNLCHIWLVYLICGNVFGRMRCETQEHESLIKASSFRLMFNITSVQIGETLFGGNAAWHIEAITLPFCPNPPCVPCLSLSHPGVWQWA